MTIKSVFRKFFPKEEKIAMLFPGQGAQFLGMGQNIPPEISVDLLKEAKIVIGEDLASLIFYLISSEVSAIQNPQEKQKLQKELNRYAQLTTFITSYGLWLSFLDQTNKIPYRIAGHSLGEITALCAAKAISFPIALKVVNIRNSSMIEASRLFNGGMRAVVGEIKKIEDKDFRKTQVKIANFNTPQQVVITGLQPELPAVEIRLKKKGLEIKRLKVIGAFHHPEYMKLAEINLEYILNLPDTTIKEPEIPVILNNEGKIEKDPHKIRRALAKQVVSQVHWRETIESLIKDKIQKESILQIGPGQILTDMHDDFLGFEKLRRKMMELATEKR